MRIISQDGRTDLPYESVALFAEDNIIMAESLNRERIYVMAEYDSEETAMSVLNELREDVSFITAVKECGVIVDDDHDRYRLASQRMILATSMGKIFGDLYYVFPKEKMV